MTAAADQGHAARTCRASGCVLRSITWQHTSHAHLVWYRRLAEASYSSRSYCWQRWSKQLQMGLRVRGFCGLFRLLFG
jgi:hypothetical protein